MTNRWGATPEEWVHLDLVLGLTADLLPCVSNPRATISPQSNMKALGKTPSFFNTKRHVVGFTKWTQHVSTSEEVAQWSAEPDFGACIATRRIRALDIDIEDESEAREVERFIRQRHPGMPVRTRSNSGKRLLMFICEEPLTKRSFRTAGGVVELLATGQQFVACGTHPSGARYAWAAGLPNQVPTLTLAQVDELWA